jgi:amidase
MKLEEYARHDAHDLADLVRRREVSPAELAGAALEAAEKVQPRINALVRVFPERAGVRPETLPEGPLRGVPFLLKDAGMHEKGTPCELGSRLGRGLVAPHDSHLMERFRAAGLVTLGCTTTPEFAFNVTTESLLTGPTRNPWDTSRMAGGSSGGAAAAVAAGIVPMAHGNDAGGSIRIPASCCGVVGLKPTRGRIPLGPDVGEALSGLATEFALTRTVRDSAVLLDAVQGAGVGDPYVIAPPARPYREEARTAPGSLRIAFTTRAWSGVPVDAEVSQAVEQTAMLCESLGHHVQEASPAVDAAALMFATVRLGAAHLAAGIGFLASILGRVPGEDTLEATTLATYRYGLTLSATDVLGALAVLNGLCRSVGAFFQGYDVLLTPTVALLPQPLGTYDANDSRITAEQWPAHIFSFAPFTTLFNVTGHPAMSLPLHQSASGLPIGMQFVAPHGGESTLFRLAAQLEEARPWRDRHPPVHVSRNIGS